MSRAGELRIHYTPAERLQKDFLPTIRVAGGQRAQLIDPMNVQEGEIYRQQRALSEGRDAFAFQRATALGLSQRHIARVYIQGMMLYVRQHLQVQEPQKFYTDGEVISIIEKWEVLHKERENTRNQ